MNCSHEGKSAPKAVTAPNNRINQSTSSTTSQSSTSENLDARIIVVNLSTTGVSLQTNESPEELSATSANTDAAAHGQSIFAEETALDESKVMEVTDCSTSEHPEVKSEEGTARMEGQGGHRQIRLKVVPEQVIATPVNTDTTVTSVSTISPRNGQHKLDSNWNVIANQVKPIPEEDHNQSTSSARESERHENNSSNVGTSTETSQAVEDEHDRLRGTSVGASEFRNHQLGPSHQNDSNGKPANKQYHQKNAGPTTRACHINQPSSNSTNHPTDTEDLQPVYEEISTVGTTKLEHLLVEHQEVEDRLAAQEMNTIIETIQPLVCANPIQPGNVNAREEMRNVAAQQPLDAETDARVESTRSTNLGVSHLSVSSTILANAALERRTIRDLHEVEAQMVSDSGTMSEYTHHSFPSGLTNQDIAISVTVVNTFQDHQQGEIQDIRIHAISYRTLSVVLLQEEEGGQTEEQRQQHDCFVRPDDALLKKTVY